MGFLSGVPRRRQRVILSLALVCSVALGGFGGYLVFVPDDRPTAVGAFEMEPTAAGIEVVATNLSQSVSVRINDRPIERLTERDVGNPILLPTAPGDRVTIVSRTGNKSVLVEEMIDDREEVGDFIAYFTFDAGNGSTVLDRSRNGNDGQLIDDADGDGPTWIAKKERTGLRFDGESDHVYVPDITTTEVVNVTDFTVATTVRVSGQTGTIQQFVEHRYGDSEWYLETTGKSAPFGASYAVRWDDQVIDSEPKLKVGKRYVLVGTYDSETSTYSLYIDGVKVASKRFDRAVQMGELHLGRDFERTDQYFDGVMYEFRLYYTAFDERQVRTLTKAMDH